MVDVASLGLVALAALVAAVAIAAWLLARTGSERATDRRRSLERHEEARQRDPPVDLGDERVAVVEEFTTHHSGERHAMCRIEGFVVFVEDVPDDLEETEAIRLKILSFNRGHTSARARFLERA
ncbi:RNA-binding protein [Natrialbaceae archaeon GCM10025810]|uniref:RNA-binding protein n=1 Tax=Halovalidus salilacus TaxID=3075124 RepID=UPI00360C6C46